MRVMPKPSIMKLFHILTLLVAALMPSVAITAVDSVSHDLNPSFYAVHDVGLLSIVDEVVAPTSFVAELPGASYTELLEHQEKISKQSAASPALRSRPDYLKLYAQPAMNDRKRMQLLRSLRLTKLRTSGLDLVLTSDSRHERTRSNLI